MRCIETGAGAAKRKLSINKTPQRKVDYCETPTSSQGYRNLGRYINIYIKKKNNPYYIKIIYDDIKKINKKIREK